MRTIGPVFHSCPDPSGMGVTIAWKGMARSRAGLVPAEVGSTPEGGICVAVTIQSQRRCATVGNVGGAATVLKSPSLMESLANKWAFQQN